MEGSFVYFGETSSEGDISHARRSQVAIPKRYPVGNKRKKRMRFTVRRYDSVPVSTEEKHSRRTSDGDISSSVQSLTSNGSKGLPLHNGRPNGHYTQKVMTVESRDTMDNLTSSPNREPEALTSVLSPIARRGQVYAGRQTTRLVKKEGDCNISNMNVSSKRSKYLVDIFTTLLDMKWRYCILLFALAFLISWLVFAVVYYVICILHDDHKHQGDDDWEPCHSEVYDFTTAFLFSLETQHTIGYGSRAMTSRCPPAIITLCAQSCIGVFLQCIVTGLVFAKLSRPKRRGQTIMFSEKAVICQRDGKLNLLFRVGDMRKSHFVGTSIRAVMVKNRLTKEGEEIPLCIHPLPLETESSGKAGDGFVFLIWPVVVTHHIDQDSPLWDISAEQLLTERLEIIVILEGTVESSGMTTQVRTSYLPSEILWGHRPAPLLTFEKGRDGYRIDNKQFHATIPVSMPECSAKELAEMSSEQRLRSDDESNDFPINLTAPPAHFTPRRAGASSGPLRRLKNSLKKNRRHSEVPFANEVMKKRSSGSLHAGVHRGSVPHVDYSPSPDVSDISEPPTYDQAKSLKKCQSETGIILDFSVASSSDVGGSGDGPGKEAIEMSSAVS